MRRRGVTQVEVAVGVASLGVLLVMASLVLAGDGRGDETGQRTTKDARQLRDLHQVLVIFAAESDEWYPRPGLIDRLPVEIGGSIQEIPGRGEEDVTANTTANLYSTLIVQNYIGPEIAVSPVERNPHVAVKKDYDWNKYNPAEDVYWDPGFAADLAAGSNASYAHLPMFGTRAKVEWRSSFNAKYAVLGNRGPAAGEPDWKSYTCDPHGRWSGHVVFNDAHIEYLQTMTPEAVRRGEGDDLKSDNLFAMEEGAAGGDVVLSFTRAMSKDGPALQHD